MVKLKSSYAACHTAFCGCILFYLQVAHQIKNKPGLSSPSGEAALLFHSLLRTVVAQKPAWMAAAPNLEPWVGPALLPPPPLATIGQASTYLCTQGYSTPGSQPRAPCIQSHHGPLLCTAGFAAGCRWSRSLSTGSMGSTPATVHPLSQQAQKRWTQQSYYQSNARLHRFVLT